MCDCYCHTRTGNAFCAACWLCRLSFWHWLWYHLAFWRWWGDPKPALLPSPVVRRLDDGALCIEWHTATTRVAIIFERDTKKSGWHIVDKNGLAASGPLGELSPDRLIHHVEKMK